MHTPLLLALFCLATALASPTALADDGHGHDAAPAAAGGQPAQRFAAASPTFELVGVVLGRQITLYVDRFADNAPVQSAQVELTVAGARVTLEEHTPGEFDGQLAQALRPGTTPVTAKVTAGGTTDTIVAQLDMPAAAAHADAAARPWRPWLVGGAATVALALVAALLVRRSRLRGQVGVAA